MTGNKITMQYLNDRKERVRVQTEAFKKATRRATVKVTKTIAIFLVLSGLGTFGLVKVNAWLDDNQVIVRLPIEVSYKTNEPVKIVKRQVAVTVSSEQAKVDAIVAKETDKDLAKYICNKFGAIECQTALAVAKAESGMNCNALNINANNSVDFSVYQINSVHMNEYSLAELTDCRKNVDIAYEIWSVQGWSPWVAFTNGAYLSRL